MAGSGWNAGASFANSFLQTLQGLEAAENAQMQNKLLKRRINQEQEFDDTLAEISKQRQGVGGTGVEQALDTGLQFKDFTREDGTVSTGAEQMGALKSALKNLTPEEQQAAIRAYGGSEYAARGADGKPVMDLSNINVYKGADGQAMATGETRALTQKEIYTRLAEKMGEKGNPYGYRQALDVKKLAREDDRANKEDEFNDWMAASREQIQKDPVAFIQNNLHMYNSPGKGSTLDDTMTAKVVPTADGKGASFIQMDKKGKVVSSTPINTETAMQAFERLAFERYRSLPGKFKDSYEMSQKDRDLTMKEGYYKSAEAENYAKVGYYGALGNAAGGGGKGGGGKSKRIPLAGGYSFDDRTGLFYDGLGNQVKDQETIAKLTKLGSGAAEKPQSLGDGYLWVNGAVHTVDPKNPGRLLKVEMPGQNPIVAAWGGGQQGAPAPAAPRSAIPAGPQVPNRPLYNADQRDLERLAKRPRGVSTAEANEAQAELDARRNEPRMSAIR